jgi:23S rRNA pseudouridine2605 synthase
VSEERLQKVLARAGVASRRKVEELIREGRVTVNGQVAGIGDKADLERDAVKVDGKRIQPPRGHRYLLLYKPREVMTTVSDPEGRPTVIDLVPPGLRKALVPVGRLDFHTEGLLLLTDDGEFAQQVAHPRHGCVKTYEVKVKGRPEERDLDRLREGVVLDGRRTSPCRIRPRPAAGRQAESENSWWLVELSEGRTRQIRDMFERIGHPVQKLRRVAIGPVSDPTLGPGDLRELTAREVEMLRRKPTRSAPAAVRRVRERREADESPVGAARRKRAPRRDEVATTAPGRGRRPASRPRDEPAGGRKALGPSSRSERPAGNGPPRPGGRRGAAPGRGPGGRTDGKGPSGRRPGGRSGSGRRGGGSRPS